MEFDKRRTFQLGIVIGLVAGLLQGLDVAPREVRLGLLVVSVALILKGNARRSSGDRP